MRSDNDTWDITSSVGATALMVAALRAAETRRPDALFTDPYAELWVSATGSPAWQRFLNGELGDVDAHVSEWYGPMGSTMVARTCYFDTFFDNAVQAGLRQTVILASGLDSRAYRLEWPPGTVVFELDQPKVLEYKAQVLASHGTAAAVDRREVPVDLRQDWPAALREKGFRPDVPTAWLAEGLLGYLPPQAQDRLFSDIVALSAFGSRVGLNFSDDILGDPETDDRAGADREQLRLLRQRRARLLTALGIDLDVESLRYTGERRTDPREWSSNHGWTVTQADPIAILTDRGRVVSGASSPWMTRRALVTASKSEVGSR